MSKSVEQQDVERGLGESGFFRGRRRRGIFRQADRLLGRTSRISIEVSKRQHARLKSMAARQGISLKALVLLRTLGETSADTDLAELERMLNERIAHSESAGARRRSVGAIFRQARSRSRRATDA